MTMTTNDRKSPPAVKDPYQTLIDAALKAVDYMELIESQTPVASRDMLAVPDELRAAADSLSTHLRNNVVNRGGTLELHGFPDRVMDLTEQLYANAAGTVAKDGELEFDSATVVSMGDDPGAYVLGWTWIPEADLEQPYYFEGSVYYVSEGGVQHLLKEDACIAIDEDDAKRILLEWHWDPKFDAAGCKPLVVWKELTVDTYEFTLNDGKEFSSDETVTIDAPSPEVATQILEIMRPNAKVVEDEEDDDESEADA